MNKDMINIDDFVREKLGGHTEKEDPAAWLRMKELLDKEQPERAAPFLFRWRKPMAFLGAALLIGALCVGSYQLNALREKGTNDNNNTNTTVHHPAPNDNPARHQVNTNNNQEPSVTAENTNNSPAGNTLATAENNKDNTPENTPAATPVPTGSMATTAPQPTPASESTGTTQRHNAHDGTQAPENKSVASRSAAGRKGQRKKDAAGLTASSRAAKTQQGTETTLAETQTTGGKDTNPAKPKADVWASGTTKAKAHSTKHLKNSKSGTNSNHTGNGTGTGLAKTNTGDVGHSEQTVATKDAPKDSMKAITVITKESATGFPKKVTQKVDTVAETKVASPVQQQPELTAANTTVVSNTQPSKKQIRAAATESRKANKRLAKAEAEQQKNILAANTANNTSATQSKAEKAGSGKKQKSGLSKWMEGMNLPEAVASAKQDIRNAQFYPGLTLGTNYSFSANNNSFQGVQFGPTGELVFNKHWSLFGAIRYFNRSGGTKTVSDNYSTETSNGTIDSTRGANYYFTVQTDSTSRHFNFSTVHSFEMPIAMRYAFRKFYIMTGINLAYYLPVNVEKVEKNVGVVNSRAISTNTAKPILAENNGKLTVNDFGSRFGLGYLFGVGYQITPAWQVDVKMVNSFWDNSKGTGAKSLSKDFYRLPSLQLSVGYQFNRGNNRPTFGPTDPR